MSKDAATRALREAKYAARTAQPAATGRPRPPVAPVAPVAPRPTDRAPVAATGAATGDGLCGHRSMNGRTCTREHGHAAKSHRYS